MSSNQLYLLKDRRFLPIFLVQLFGCLNDNILKNALIILLTYELAHQLGQWSQPLVLLTNAIFILPYAIFASLSGQLADKYERSTLVKIIKFAEIFIVLLSCYGFAYHNLTVLFICVALMGIHSTFFGPIKYSVLPDHMHKNELLSANGFVEAGTFISILIGTILGGFYTLNSTFVMAAAILASLIGFVTSMFLPKSNNADSSIKISLNIVRETIDMVKFARSKKPVYMAILGISWFWFVGAVILAQIASLSRNILGADETVANLFLATFSLGVGIGSLLCSKILKNNISTKYIFAAAIGASLFGIDLFFASRISASYYQEGNLKNILVFLSSTYNWRIIVDFFFFAVMSGFYIVPLFALMQYFSTPSHRSRIIAANNLINSAFIVMSTMILSILFYFDFTVPTVILFASISNLLVAFYIYWRLPERKILSEAFFRILFTLIYDIFYRVEVKGLENFHNAGKRVVIVANHLSYIDPAIIATYIPETLIFPINSTIRKLWYIKPFLHMVRILPIDQSNAMALKTLINELKTNRKVAIFPEGRISTTGALMKVYQGAGLIAEKADAVILPVRIDGTQYTHFSKLQGIRKQLFPKITLTILPAVKVSAPEALSNKHKRDYMEKVLHKLMVDSAFQSADYHKPVFQSIIDSVMRYGYSRAVLQDFDQCLSYRSLLIRSFVLAEIIAKNTDYKERVGVMLPTSIGGIISICAMQAIGRVPAMLNFTSGASNVLSACNSSGVKLLYTSTKFIKTAHLESIIEFLEAGGIKIIYLEQLKPLITAKLKIKALIGSFFAQSYYDSLRLKYMKAKNPDAPAYYTKAPAEPYDTAVNTFRDVISAPQSTEQEMQEEANDIAFIIFTSGTEGKPKAVALSHANLQANVAQLMAKVDLTPNDVTLNALPIFHGFGLIGTLLPMLNGIRTFVYPSPLHYHIIPEIIYDFSVTVMFSTSTFLYGYGSEAHKYDLHSLRYVFAGAEKLRPETRQLWIDKFGIRILEGYGVTEASPVVAVNTTIDNSEGSVGQLLPGMEYVVKPVDGISDGGCLYIKGPNIMLGYVDPNDPCAVNQPVVENLGYGWYNTGDIVTVNEEGYIKIIGRIKRFAKLAGEMISLPVIEDLVYKLDSKNAHAAINISDARKGERIILFTTSAEINYAMLVKHIKESGYSELYVPKTIIKLDEIPIMANGKVDYQKLSKMPEIYNA